MSYLLLGVYMYGWDEIGCLSCNNSLYLELRIEIYKAHALEIENVNEQMRKGDVPGALRQVWNLINIFCRL